MKSRLIEESLAELAQAAGVRAVALVDGGSGLVWHARGGVEVDPSTWEAGVDYWRLYKRTQSHFAALDELRAAVMYHRRGVLAILPCRMEEDLFVLCVADHGQVDWRDWQHRVRALGEELGKA